jgi:outer membrane protein assembly factor BamA
VVVAYPELLVDLDFRDDPISPTKGLFLSNSLQVAIPALGGQLSDVRIRPEARAYLPLDYGRKLILAARATFGFVFPQNYGDALLNPDAETLDADVVRDQHRLLFRAFYSGGPQSNRGYPYQRIGPQGPIGFLLPTGVDCTGNPSTVPATCILPLGGFSLWEASLELRWKFASPWGAVLFVDASDVNPGIFSVTWDAPHISVGPGLRYLSPIGPVRVDLGFRVPGLQKLSGTPESPLDISDTAPYSEERWERWYDALALQVLVGEAF